MYARKLLWILALLLAVTSFACGSSGGLGDIDGGDTPEDDMMDDGDEDVPGDTPTDGDDDMMVPMGDAGLTFVPLRGGEFKTQFDPGAKPFIPEDTSSDLGDLLVLLCATEDPTCEDPQVRLVDESNPEEWEESTPDNPAPIQESFGPTITIPDLPAGTWNLTIVYDSLDSQRRGYGWQDDFDTDETAWGGFVSETDLILSDGEASSETNPPATTIEVTLTDGESTDLGELILGHYHERKISEPPAADTGTLVVGNKTDNSIRLINLNDFSLVEASSDPVRLDFPLTTSDNMVINGSLCNVIPGPDSTVYAIFAADSGAADAGYAVQWDPATQQQLSGMITFEDGNHEAGPCRAIWHQNGGQDYLFAVAAGGSNDGNKKGFWYANVTDLSSGDIVATQLEMEDDPFFDVELMNVAAYEDEIYIGTNTTELPSCGGETCLYVADIDTDGLPTLRTEAGEYVVWKAGLLRGDVSLPELGNQTVACNDVEQGINYFGLQVVNFKKTGQDLLFVGNCHEIMMIDLADGSLLDFDEFEPGFQGLNGALFGGGFYQFQISPDGDTVWAVSANKSRLAHSVVGNEPGPGELGDGRISVDRHALMPIDISASAPNDLPSVAAAYTTTNRDDFDGVPPDGINDLQTPAEDPGIDIRGLFLKGYYVFWNRSLSGELPNPFPVGPSIAVGNNTIWMRGSGADLGAEGPSGLGQGSNLSVFDLDTQRLVLWPRTPGGEFYEPWVGLKQFVFGYHLTPMRQTTVATAGLVYVP